MVSHLQRGAARSAQGSAGMRRKLDPDLALKVPWSREEDELLLRLQEVHDNHWAEMAKSIQGRNAQMCRTRCLSPPAFLL